jgi:hypothetical protein
LSWCAIMGRTVGLDFIARAGVGSGKDALPDDAQLPFHADLHTARRRSEVP